MDKHI